MRLSIKNGHGFIVKICRKDKRKTDFMSFYRGVCIGDDDSFYQEFLFTNR